MQPQGIKAIKIIFSLDFLLPQQLIIYHFYLHFSFEKTAFLSVMIGYSYILKCWTIIYSLSAKKVNFACPKHSALVLYASTLLILISCSLNKKKMQEKHSKTTCRKKSCQYNFISYLQIRVRGGLNMSKADSFLFHTTLFISILYRLHPIDFAPFLLFSVLQYHLLCQYTAVLVSFYSIK